MSTQAATLPSPRDENVGMALGLAAVMLFALTIPMTRMASLALPSVFVGAGRAALSGLLAAGYLWAVGARWPRGGEWGLIAWMALGGVFGWTGLMAIAVRYVDAVHASVVSGIIPLATALLAAMWAGQRPSRGFWLCAAGAALVVVGYALGRSGGRLHGADALLLAAVLLCALGYVAGAQLTRTMPAAQVGSWVLALCLPISLPLAAYTWPQTPAPWSAWGAWLYVSIVSAWLGMFVWYRALALGGAVRVSQTQAVQPFASMLLAALLLGERLDALTLVCGAAVVGLVVLGRRMPVRQSAPLEPAVRSTP